MFPHWQTCGEALAYFKIWLSPLWFPSLFSWPGGLPTPYTPNSQDASVVRKGSGWISKSLKLVLTSILGEVSQYNLYSSIQKIFQIYCILLIYTIYTLNIKSPLSKKQLPIQHHPTHPHPYHPQLAKVLLQPRWLLWMHHWPLLLQWHFSRLRRTMQVAPVAVQGAGRQRPAC